MGKDVEKCDSEAYNGERFSFKSMDMDFATLGYNCC